MPSAGGREPKTKTLTNQPSDTPTPRHHDTRRSPQLPQRDWSCYCGAFHSLPDGEWLDGGGLCADILSQCPQLYQARLWGYGRGSRIPGALPRAPPAASSTEKGMSWAGGVSDCCDARPMLRDMVDHARANSCMASYKPTARPAPGPRSPMASGSWLCSCFPDVGSP